MSNPWITPMWIMLAVVLALNALMQATLHSASWPAVTGMWAFSFVLWGVCAFKAWRYDR